MSIKRKLQGAAIAVDDKFVYNPSQLSFPFLSLGSCQARQVRKGILPNQIGIAGCRWTCAWVNRSVLLLVAEYPSLSLSVRRRLYCIGSSEYNETRGIWAVDVYG